MATLPRPGQRQSASTLFVGTRPGFQERSPPHCSTWRLFEPGRRRLHRCDHSVNVSHAEKSSFSRSCDQNHHSGKLTLNPEEFDAHVRAGDTPHSDKPARREQLSCSVGARQCQTAQIKSENRRLANAAEKSPEQRTWSRVSCLYLLPLCVWGQEQKQGIRSTETDVIANI